MRGGGLLCSLGGAELQKAEQGVSVDLSHRAMEEVLVAHGVVVVGVHRFVVPVLVAGAHVVHDRPHLLGDQSHLAISLLEGGHLLGKCLSSTVAGEQGDEHLDLLDLLPFDRGQGDVEVLALQWDGHPRGHTTREKLLSSEGVNGTGCGGSTLTHPALIY